MAEFSGKIITAFYAYGSKNKVIDLLYTADDGHVREFSVQVDPKNLDYQSLVAEGWTEDRIAEVTAERGKLNTYTNKKLAELIEKDKQQVSTSDFNTDILDIIIEKNYDKVAINNLKDWVLNHQHIDKAARGTKTKIRKIKSLAEGIELFSAALNGDSA